MIFFRVIVVAAIATMSWGESEDSKQNLALPLGIIERLLKYLKSALLQKDWVDALEKKLEEAEEKINYLEREVDTLEYKTAKKIKSISDETGTKIQNVKKATEDAIDGVETKLSVKTKVSSDINYLKKRIQVLEGKKGGWPKGSYCILANGSCPTGFKRYEVLTHSSIPPAEKANFGDSHFRKVPDCYACDKKITRIRIVTCCK
jgi:hypothetical protein